MMHYGGQKEMNSWQTGKEESHINIGEFVMIPPDDRGAGYDIGDSTVTDTWELADLSDIVPKGTKAVYVYIGITTSSTNDRSILLTKNYNSIEIGTDAGLPGTYTSIIYAELGAYNLYLGIRNIIMAENGKFYYRRYASTHPIDYLYFKLLGYFI